MEVVIMKVCKKCKRKVPNKAKICKYCSADVTKCKIIKENSSSAVVKKYNGNSTKGKGSNKRVSVLDNSSKLVEKSVDVKNCVSNDKKVSIFDRFNELKLINKIKDIKKNRIKKERALARRPKTVKEAQHLKYRKILRIGLTVFAICVGIFLFVLGFRKVFHLSDIKVVKEGTYNNIFDMNDKIKYKGVIYSVTSSDISYGTEFKSPKEDNVFVIVNIDFENDSKEKIRYSYKDWKMSNDLGEESSRVFTPINVSTALYSGNLVVGGKKSGSLVFEEPADSEKLLLNYYEYEGDDDSALDDEDDDRKPVFQIRVTTPKDKINK